MSTAERLRVLDLLWVPGLHGHLDFLIEVHAHCAVLKVQQLPRTTNVLQFRRMLEHLAEVTIFGGIKPQTVLKLGKFFRTPPARNDDLLTIRHVIPNLSCVRNVPSYDVIAHRGLALVSQSAALFHFCMCTCAPALDATF